MHVIWNTVQHGQFLCPFENKDTIFWVEGFSDLAYEFCSCVDIVVNHILTKYGHLMQGNCDLFWVFSKDCASLSTKKTWALGVVKL